MIYRFEFSSFLHSSLKEKSSTLLPPPPSPRTSHTTLQAHNAVRVYTITAELKQIRQIFLTNT